MLYRVVIRDKQSGEEYRAQFEEIPYLEYVCFSPEEKRYTPPVYRYIFAKYLISLTKAEKGEAGEEHELGSEYAMTKLPEHLVKLLVDAMFDKSRTVTEDDFDKLIEYLGKQSLTKLGTYDVFLYIHLGPEMYLQLLNAPTHVRAQLITLIEKTTGINVRDRFEEALRTGAPVDLITTGAAYDRQRRKGVSQQPITKKYAGKFAQEELPADIDQMIEASQRSLSEVLEAARRGKPEKFSWTKEAAEMSRFESERDRILLSRERVQKGE